MNRDIVIVGGGISGCAAAYFLSRSGFKPTLIEKDGIAAHASGFAFGMVSARFQASPNASAMERLLALSVDIHHALAERLIEEGGGKYRAQKKAALHLALSEADAERLRVAGIAAYRASDWDIDRGDIRWLGYGELSHIEARVTPEAIGALYVGNQLEIAPGELTNALWEAAVASSGADMINAEASRIQVEGGKVKSVETSVGVINCDSLILAAGPWSGELLKRDTSTAALKLPIKPLKGQILRYDIADQPSMPVSIWWNGNYASSKPDGLLYAGTTEESVGFDEQPTEQARRAITNSAVRVLPFLKDARVVKQTACLRPITEDRLPVIGELPGARGLIVASGGGRSGIELGPSIGETAARIAINREKTFFQDLSPARFG